MENGIQTIKYLRKGEISISYKYSTFFYEKKEMIFIPDHCVDENFISN